MTQSKPLDSGLIPKLRCLIDTKFTGSTWNAVKKRVNESGILGKDQDIEVEMSPEELEKKKVTNLLRRRVLAAVIGEAFDAAQVARCMSASKDFAKIKVPDVIDGVRMNKSGDADTIGGLCTSEERCAAVRKKNLEQEQKKRGNRLMTARRR